MDREAIDMVDTDGYTTSEHRVKKAIQTAPRSADTYPTPPFADRLKSS